VEVCTAVSVDESHPVSVTWTAYKNGTVPVPGTITGSLDLKLKDGGLKGATFNFEFDPSTIASQEDTRDGRIKKYFFQTDLFPTASYRSTVDSVEGGDYSLPQPGQTRKVTLAGQLTMAGQIVQVSVLTTLVNDGKQIVLANDGKNYINAQATSTLAQNVAALIAAANVTSMDPSVKLESSTVIQSFCVGQ
jgi:hypothetical protein